MTQWLGIDLSQGSTKRGLTMVVAAVAVYFLIPMEGREQALLALIGGHGVLGSILKD